MPGVSAAPDRALTRPMFVLASHRRKPPQREDDHQEAGTGSSGSGGGACGRGLGAEAGGGAAWGCGTGAAWERLIVTWRGPLPEGAYVPEPEEAGCAARPEPGAYDGGFEADAGW